MAQIRYRANLSAKDFVFSSQQWGRSVVMKQYDQNFSRQIVSPTDPDKDIGIPQIFYCHNVMPAAQGFQSIGLNPLVTPIRTDGEIFQVIKYTNTSDNSWGYLGFANSGSSTYTVYQLEADAWVFVANITGIVDPGQRKITVANVGGQTYILIPETNCYTFDPTVGLTLITLTGLAINTIDGICDSYGYMIAWSGTTIAWSSTLTPTDFTPSLITGAGGGGVTALKGGITYCQHHTFGFIVFSQFNCVAAVYSGNTRFPFNFREIIGGGGLDQYYYTDLDSESGNLYAWTTNGMQLVSVTQAQVVFPELTDYIGGSRFEDFNDETLQFIETDVANGTLSKAINVISGRYLIISYGLPANFPNYTHALVYDISMKRWGKIKQTHVQVFEFNWHNATDERARTSIGFLDDNGGITEIDFSYLSVTGGTIILGKYQHARDRLITLQQIDLEYVANSGSVTINVLPTLDGKTFLIPTPITPIGVVASQGQYPCRITGMNISLILQGFFQLDSLMLTYIPNGRR